MFVSVEGDEDIYGALYSYKLDGTDEKLLKSGLNRPYGLCVDDVKSHVYYVQGGHGGSISCMAYSSSSVSWSLSTSSSSSVGSPIMK